MAQKHTQPSPLLRLPLEIRLMIYEYLLFPSAIPSTSHSTSIANLLPDFHAYYSSDTNDSPFTLSVRTIDPYLGPKTSHTWRKRSTYHVRTGPFLTTTTPTTYRVLLSPYTSHLRQTIPSLLSLNHQIHAEAAKVLYSTYTFSFHTSIEAAVPFLSDLTPLARSYVRSIGLTKKGFPYTKEFDRAEWSALCTYLSANLCLRTLELSVVAGKPGEDGWDDVAPITADDFALIHRMKKEWGTQVGSGGSVDLEWVEHLFKVEGLRSVVVRALVEHCPRPMSEMMAFWIAFSRSVDGGFGEWVRGVMVSAGA